MTGADREGTQVRGDAAVTIRLLLRPTGLAGLAAALGGITALGATLLPWHEVVATVDMLGAASSRTEARTAALPDWWWGWTTFVAGATALWLGIAIAIDRPARWARTAMVVAAALLAVGAAVALLAPPQLDHLGDVAATVGETAQRLPTGVDLELGVRASVGPWVTLVAATLVAVGAVGSWET